jgi:hypothetical protein
MVLCSFCENITIDRIDIDAEPLAQLGSAWEPSQRLTLDTINNLESLYNIQRSLYNITRLSKEAEAMYKRALVGDGKTLGTKEPLGYDHQPSYPALLESAKSCELCRLISEVAERDGIFPEFDPKFDVIPDQIARRNASQRLKLSAFQQSTTGSSSTSNCRQLSGVLISNAQGLCILLEMFADEGQFYNPRSMLRIDLIERR